MKSTLAFGVLMSTAASAAFAAGGLSTILHDKLTVVIILINVIATIFFLRNFDRFAVSHGPEILTTVGIFGCFLGIALALLNFDSANVSASVPLLLEGVKTAFWASVSGVGGALVLRIKHKLHKAPIQQAEGAPKSSNMDDVVLALKDLQKSIAGNDDGALLTQLKLIRQDQTDQSQALRHSFDEFAKRMAEDGSKVLIEALREVIADFNAQINEQFGENFKELNRAVSALVIWQQQYKEELDKLQSIQAQSSNDLQSAAANLSELVKQSAGFVDAASTLETLLTGLAQQYEIIQQSEQALHKVLIEMKDVTPKFATKVEELSDALRNGVETVQSEVTDLLRNFGVQNQSSNAELKGLLVDTLKKSQGDVNDQLLKGLEIVRQSVVTLDKGLQDELTKSLETLGRQLASLSEKFVSDYTPLTERLREVVRLAEKTS
jgi:multisubunit Na+/H+ antiporter MnhG subunit